MTVWNPWYWVAFVSTLTLNFQLCANRRGGRALLSNAVHQKHSQHHQNQEHTTSQIAWTHVPLYRLFSSSSMAGEEWQSDSGIVQKAVETTQQSSQLTAHASAFALTIVHCSPV
jgi:hypothetical protein